MEGGVAGGSLSGRPSSKNTTLRMMVSDWKNGRRYQRQRQVDCAMLDLDHGDTPDVVQCKLLLAQNVSRPLCCLQQGRSSKVF